MGQEQDISILEVSVEEKLIDDNTLPDQMSRDIDMLSKAIVCCGAKAYDKTKAHTLLKSILFLYFADISYRDKKDGVFYSWNELNSGPEPLPSLPIAAILLHGSRVLIEFSAAISQQIMDWLLPDEASWRYMATHGISVLSEDEREILKGGSIKYLQEIKVDSAREALRYTVATVANVATNATTLVGYMTSPATNLFSKLIPYSNSSSENAVDPKTSHAETANYSSHYGINLALGGIGNKNFRSKQLVANDGSHGHLYIYHHEPVDRKRGGILLGIEQSASGWPDQYGGSHDPMASKKKFSASGGDFFCQEGALQTLPIANYYDSIFNFISDDDFSLIQDAYKKTVALLELLPEEKALALIEEIVSSTGKANRETFNNLYDSYFKQLPHCVSAEKNQEALLKEQNNRYQQVLKENEKLEEQLVNLGNEVSQLQRAEDEKMRAQLHNLNTLSRRFMATVAANMGWFHANSMKKIIFSQLSHELNFEADKNEDSLRWLLKNFIGVALMNRYDKNGGETHSGKACLKCLNNPEYVLLKTFLLAESKDNLVYKDLLLLINGNLQASANNRILSSSRYRGALYRSFGLIQGGNEKTVPQEKLDLASKQFVYEPPAVIESSHLPFTGP